MKQVTQRLRDGRVEVLDVPAPSLTPDGVLIDIRASLLSAGTERSKIQTGRQSLVGKARSRPDQVRQVVDKARRDGVRETVETVRSRLNQPSSIGYSAAGVVLAVGRNVRGIVPGQRVACGGGDYAVHAEIDVVPSNLVVPLPDTVSFDEGAFATVGSIAMHGVRQADVRLGERIGVIGLGLVGQLTGQLLHAAGCTVVGVDLSPAMVALSRELGSVDAAWERGDLDPARLPAEVAECDAVIITAATQSPDPVTLAAQMCRDRGRVVAVGDVGMDLPRAAYYDKELELRLSRSYGPGRYDRDYEERGLDYPIGYVRWTERRNMAAVVELVGTGRIDVTPLITERIPIDQASEAYEQLVSADRSPLGLVLQYEPSEAPAATAAPQAAARATVSPHVSVIGAGSFAQRVLIPAFRDAGFALEAVASATGLSARAAQERFGFKRAVAPEAAVADAASGMVVVATRHASHAELAEASLRAGKAVYVEKPPFLTWEQHDALEEARRESRLPLFVGFNRRHAELAVKLREHVAGRGQPVEVLYRVNAGALPPGHWLNDVDDGGGRLVGEGCHFVDFACWVVGALPDRVGATLAAPGDHPIAAAQSFTVSLGFEDGSVATVLYTASGAAGLGKEYVEAHAGGRSAVLDDFRTLDLYGTGRKQREESRSGEKGHKRQVEHLRAVLKGEAAPSEPDPLASMAVTLRALDAARGVVSA